MLNPSTSNLRGMVWPHIMAYVGSHAHNTQRAYFSDLALWIGFLGEDPDSISSQGSLFLTCNSSHANAFKVWLGQRAGASPRKSQGKSIILRGSSQGQGFMASNATIARRLACLRGLYEYLLAQDVVGKNPFNKYLVKSPKADTNKKRENIALTDTQVESLLAMPSRNCVKGMRDACLLTILFCSGARRQEVCNLLVSDVRKDPHGRTYLYFRAPKSGKDRKCPIPSWAEKDLSSWVSYRQREGARPEHSLLVSFYATKGERIHIPLTPDALYKIFVRYCAILGIDANPHCARVTVVTHLRGRNVSPEDVMIVTGHSSPKMVAVYDKRLRELNENPSRLIKYS